MKKVITKLKDTTGNYHGFMYSLLDKKGNQVLDISGLPLLYPTLGLAKAFKKFDEKIIKVYINLELEVW